MGDLRAYKPTLREKAHAAIVGDRNPHGVSAWLADGLVGRAGQKFGLADLLPVFAMEEAGRDLATPGRRIAGGVSAVTAAIPIPAARAGGRAAAKQAGKAAAAALDMSAEARMARAKAMGFDRPVYHGTSSDFPAFDPAMAGQSTGSLSARQGVWTSPSPQVAAEYAKAPASGAANAGPNVLPLRLRSDRMGRVDLDGSELDLEIAGTIKDAFESGYDSILLRHPAGSDYIVAKDPAQLRSIFAAFDPAKKGSSNLLASGAGAGLLATALTRGELERGR